jgi:tetratricopeptide (TPR) repeat protein
MIKGILNISNIEVIDKVINWTGTDQHEKQRLEELKKILEQEPNNSEILTTIGAFIFTSFNPQVDKATIHFLSQAIEVDKKNVDARFWLATCVYDHFCDYDGAKKLLEEALILAPYRADCLNLMFYVLWHSTGKEENGIGYLLRGIEYAPDWPLPRRQLIQFFISRSELELAEKEIGETVALLKEKPVVPDDIIKRYYETCITGRISPHNKEDLSDMLKLIEEKRKQIRSVQS